MQHGIRSASDSDIALANYRAEIRDIMADFRPPVEKIVCILNDLEPFAVTEERERSRADMLAFFTEKREEVDFAPALDCRFPFFWGRFSRAWLEDADDEAHQPVAVVRPFPDAPIEREQSSW